MKKYLILAALMLALVGCNTATRTESFFVQNQTDKELVIQYRPDRTFVMRPGEYLQLFSRVIGKDEVEPDNGKLIPFVSPLYITMDGVQYEVNDDADGCLYAKGYHEATDSVAEMLRQNKNEHVFLFSLIEEYIKQQIVVEGRD